MKIVYDGQKDRAFKDVLGATIPRLAEEDKDVIYLDADLMSCIGTAKWAVSNPDRAINCGIAEANMIGIAAGLSAVGFKPIVHTFGPFASRRCYDQVFLSGGYAGNALTIIGTDPGVCAAFNGGTHMPFEDIATIFDITDAAMLEDVLTQCKDREGVTYIRVGRKNNKKIYEEGTKFEIGKANVLQEGADAVIVACGIMVAKAMEAAEILKAEGVNTTVIDMFTIKPLDEALLIQYAKSTGAVITAENHNKMGGLYSAVSECIGSHCPTPIEYVAVEDEFGEVGPQDYLEERFGLTSAHIVEKVKAAIARK
ncbi:MAG: transketolase C-terminal domain-containing protein [Lachnospiraceae bacterium]